MYKYKLKTRNGKYGMYSILCILYTVSGGIYRAQKRGIQPLNINILHKKLSCYCKHYLVHKLSFTFSTKKTETPVKEAISSIEWSEFNNKLVTNSFLSASRVS